MMTVKSEIQTCNLCGKVVNSNNLCPQCSCLVVRMKHTHIKLIQGVYALQQLRLKRERITADEAEKGTSHD